MNEIPRVLIVIITYNAAEYIGDCLSSVARARYPREFFKTLVIDNGSTDGSIDFVKTNFADVEVVVNEKNLGFAGGNNVGMRYAIDHNFDYVYLLNQDTVVSEDFINEAVVVARTDARIGAVQSKLLLHDKPELLNSRGNMIHYLGFAFAGGYLEIDRPLEISEIAYASGASCLLNVSALKEVGLFNDGFFMYHEDTDLGWRFWLAGWRVVLAPKSAVYHKYEFSRSIKKYYFMERNRVLVLLQNYTIATLLLLSPMLLIMDVGMLLYSFVNGWWKYKLSVYAYFTDPLVWKNIFATRRTIQASRKRKDRDVISHFTGRIEFQDVDSPLLRYVVNPVLNAYWQLIRRIVWW